ncbi:hypothetical protein K435DRAFT_620800, partial [Dendrothele bispora CBS 962.96]
ARTTGLSARRPFRHRKKWQVLKLTNAEKLRRRNLRKAKKEEYQDHVDVVLKMVWAEAERIHSEVGNRSASQIFEDIMQTARLRRTSRKTNRFNAFLRTEMRRINEALGPDESRRKVNDCALEIAEKWKSMSEDEQKAATEDAMKELGDHRENRHLGAHNSAISTFHDFRTSMDAVKLELQRLNARTGTEVILIAVRSNVSHFHRPEVVTTSDRPMDFINMAFKQPISDVAARMEGFMISGVEEECAGRNKIPRMYYVNFADKITRVHRIVVKNWPLEKFINPSSLGSMIEVELLLNAWNSGTTYFYKLTTSEYEDWEKAGFDKAV